MSRIGKKPVGLPSGVTATVSGQTVEIKGPKGVRTFKATDDVSLAVEDSAVSVTPRGSSKRARQQWGMSRTQIANCVTGVTDGFKKRQKRKKTKLSVHNNGSTSCRSSGVLWEWGCKNTKHRFHCGKRNALEQVLCGQSNLHAQSRVDHDRTYVLGSWCAAQRYSSVKGSHDLC